MTQLQWWPFDPEIWQRQTAHLSFEEAGALLHVLGVAWRDPIACTIPASEAGLQRLLGPNWWKLQAVIREQFTPDLEHPGRLRCDWLAERYAAQLKRYEARRKPGGLGGTMKAAQRKLKRGQHELFPASAASNANPEPAKPASNASSIATAKLAQIVEGSSPFGREDPPSVEENAVVADAAGAAPPAGEPDVWTGPGTRELHQWVSVVPERSALLEARVEAELATLHLSPQADRQAAKHWLRIPIMRELWRASEASP